MQGVVGSSPISSTKNSVLPAPKVRVLCLLFYFVWYMIRSMLYIIRHGQTRWNQENKFQGMHNTSLDKVGVDQAKDVAQYFQSGDFDIKRIVSSDLRRAKQTARVIGKKLNIRVEYDSRLREYDFGQLEGKTPFNVPRETLAQFMQNPQSMDGEPFEDAFARISAVLNNIDYNTNTILVSHGGIMRFAMFYFENGSVFDTRKFLDSWHKTHMGNASVFRVASHDSKMELYYQMDRIKNIGNQK